MKPKNILIVAALVVGAVIAGALFSRQPLAEKSAPQKITVAAAVKTPAAPLPAAVPPVPEAAATGTPAIASSASEKSPPAKPAKILAQKKSPKPKEPIQDPAARAALSLVGADPVAEAYWLSAINDPNLPANERKDLIEDLNEDGLSDPKHPGLEDVPLIVSRLQLIEGLLPDALDGTNAEALAEAHKDLVAMLNGEPVQ